MNNDSELIFEAYKKKLRLKFKVNDWVKVNPGHFQDTKSIGLVGQIYKIGESAPTSEALYYLKTTDGRKLGSGWYDDEIELFDMSKVKDEKDKPTVIGLSNI